MATDTPLGQPAPSPRDEPARDAERLLVSVVESLSDAYQAIGGDWRFTYVNQAFRRILSERGLEADVVGKHVFDEAFPESRDTDFGRALSRAMNERVPAEVESFYEPFGRWYEVRIVPTPDGGVSLFARDVTERRRAEEALRESERRFKTVADTAPAILWITEPDGSCSFLSRGWYEFTGQTEREALGTGWLDAVHTDDREHSGRIFREANATRVPFALDYRLRRADGEYRWAIDAGRPRFGPGGEWLGFIGSVIDVHERKRAEEALRESRDVLTLAMRGGRMGAWSRNLVTNDVWWSRELEELFGLDSGQFDGTEGGFFAFVHEDDREDLARKVAEAIERGGNYAVEFRFRHASGEERWMDGRGRAVYGADGSPTMLYGIGVDITARRRAEEDRERLLAREQEASRAKDEFLAVVSHELRTPLNSMLGWVRMLRSGSLDTATGARALESIERNTLAQVQLIEDLLDVSRIVSGKLRIKVQPVDLASVVGNAVESMRPAAEAKQIRLATLLDPRAGSILGDPDRLQQVVWNLLSNAVKFTPKDGQVQVYLRRADSQVEIGVADTGVGIEPEFLPHVFERFTQADASTRRSYAGLGLGLAITRHLVELHGGTIRVRSEGRDRGATFVVGLPMSAALTDAGEGAAVHAAPRAPLSFDCPQTLVGLDLLVVDDERDTRALLAHLLERCGAGIRAVGSAEEALAAIDARPPDVLVSDVGMPRMDGYDLIAKVRAGDEARRRYLPSIALTAYARTEDRVRLLAAGYDAHLTKPVEPAELTTVIERLARRK